MKGILESAESKDKKLAAAAAATAASSGSPTTTICALFDLKANVNALLVALIFIGAFLMVSQGLYWSRGSYANNSNRLQPDPLGTIPNTLDRKFKSIEEPEDDSDSSPLEEAGKGIYSTVRHMHPVGLAAYTFVLTGGYRTRPNSFAVLGLASKPLHVYGKPRFVCEWISAGSNQSVLGTPRRILPDWGYGRAYTVVVVHCYFAQPVGADGLGGKLVLHASIDRRAKPDKIRAFSEARGEFDASVFEPPYRYDYLYCGSSLFGDINPQRLREWIAYHAMIFGPRSHFVLHDVGGLRSAETRRVLEPWVKAGRVTVQDFSEQAKFDGYYYNQFLIVNDCLFRYKYMANWTFFFDVDEYVHVRKPGTLDSVLGELGQNYSQIMFQQNLMGRNMCVKDDGRSEEDLSSQWGFEKLVFKNVKKSMKLNKKYVVKAALADSAGVHLSEHVNGKHLYSKGKIEYYHYHNTISERRENCEEFYKVPDDRSTRVWSQNIPYVYDDSMSSMAVAVKRFEREAIGMHSVNSSSRS